MIREYQRKPKTIRAAQLRDLRKAGAFVAPYKDCPDTLWLIQEPDGTERRLADDKFREEYEVPAESSRSVVACPHCQKGVDWYSARGCEACPECKQPFEV